MKKTIYIIFITLFLIWCTGNKNDNVIKLDNDDFWVTVNWIVDKEYSVWGDWQESMFILDKGFKN